MYVPFMRNFIITLASLMLISLGCSGGSPAVPGNPVESPDAKTPGNGERYLLAYCHIDIDPASGQAVVIPLREAGFHVSANALLEKLPPYGIIPEVLALNLGTGQLAVKVRLHHPDPSPVYRAFDVRGIIFTRCTYSGWSDADILMPQEGDGLYLRNPDGYTRWWNPTEFSYGADPIHRYMDGKQAHPHTGSGNYDYNGTVNPYKYFVPGHPDYFDSMDPYNLDNCIDLVDYFSIPANFENQATIPPGGQCSRIYQFKMSGDFLTHFGFNYAIDGCWALPDNLPNPDLDDFPPRAHMPEPFLVDAEIERNTLYRVDTMCQGGNLDLLVNVWDWQNFSDTSYFEHNTPAEKNHGALRLVTRGGFLDGATPSVEFVSSDEDIRCLTYRLSYSDPPLASAGTFDVMLVAEHGRTFGSKFIPADDVFMATYMPPFQIEVAVWPECFELPYDDSCDQTSWPLWNFLELKKNPPYSVKTPQPNLDDPNYYHWGLSDTTQTFTSQVHYAGGNMVQDPNGYVDSMRNMLISPCMVFPESGAAKVTIRHTFSMEPFDDFGEPVFIWEAPPLNFTYHPLYFYHFTGELPGNTSGISDGARTDVFYFDRLTKLVAGEVQTFYPTPGGEFRIGFIFDSDEDVHQPFLGWEIDNFTVEETHPFTDVQFNTIFEEHFDSDFTTQDMWDFIDAGTGGEYWGLIEFSYPGNDGTFLDAAYELSSVYDSGINEEAILTIDLPDSPQIMMKLRHRLYLDPGTRAFIAVNEIDGDESGQEFDVLYPCYAGGLFPYVFTRDTVFSTTIDPDGNHCVAEGWGHFCWTGESPEGFNTVEALDEEISTFFDLTTFSNQQVELRFIFRTGDEIIDPFWPFAGTDYATWRIEELTIKAI